MPPTTPAHVKNIIKRSLREIIDPSPSKKEIEKIWEFFESKCAYCGQKLNRKNKEGHVDHLISSSENGSNHISNRVLSCANCNEKEKRDMPWKKFLAQKNPNKTVMNERKDKILLWQQQNNDIQKNIDKKLLDEVSSMSKNIINLYDKKIRELKKLQN
jgi:hypothetical protein